MSSALTTRATPFFIERGDKRIVHPSNIGFTFTKDVAHLELNTFYPGESVCRYLTKLGCDRCDACTYFHPPEVFYDLYCTNLPQIMKEEPNWSMFQSAASYFATPIAFFHHKASNNDDGVFSCNIRFQNKDKEAFYHFAMWVNDTSFFGYFVSSKITMKWCPPSDRTYLPKPKPSKLPVFCVSVPKPLPFYTVKKDTDGYIAIGRSGKVDLSTEFWDTAQTNVDKIAKIQTHWRSYKSQTKQPEEPVTFITSRIKPLQPAPEISIASIASATTMSQLSEVLKKVRDQTRTLPDAEQLKKHKEVLDIICTIDDDDDGDLMLESNEPTVAEQSTSSWAFIVSSHARSDWADDD